MAPLGSRMPSFPKEVALAEEPAARQSVVGFLRNVNRKSTAVTQDDLWEMIDTDKDGHISKVEFAAMYSAIREAVATEHEESRGLRGKLERSRARVRLFGAAAGLLVLAVALLIPCLWAVARTPPGGSRLASDDLRRVAGGRFAQVRARR